MDKDFSGLQPQVLKEAQLINPFGVVFKEGDHLWNLSWVSKTGIPQNIPHLEPGRLEAKLLEPNMPLTWLGFSITDMFKDLYPIWLSKGWLEDRVERYKTKGRKTKIQRLDIEPSGESNIRSITIRDVRTEEGEYPSKKKTIMFKSAEDWYPKGPGRLVHDFGIGPGLQGLRVWSGLFFFFLFIAKELRVAPVGTIASTALKVLRAFHLDRPVPSLKDFPNHVDYIRTAYFGGRVQNFESKVGHAYLYDVNNFYGLPMFEDFPIDGMQESGPMEVSEFLNLSHEGFVCGDFLVHSSKRNPLPVRDPDRNRKVTYPGGEILSTQDDQKWYYTGLIKDEVNKGRVEILKIHGGIYWTEEAPILRSFIESLAEIKRGLQWPGEESIIKAFIVQMYGKFAEKGARKKTHLTWQTEEEAQKSGNVVLDEDLPYWTETVESEPPDHLIPQISAIITAKADMWLRGLLDHLENLGIHVYNIGVDQITVDKPLPPELVGAEIGQFKLEDEVEGIVFESGIARVRKSVSGLVTPKVPGITFDRLTEEDFETLWNGGVISTDQERKPKITEILAQAHIVDKDKQAFQVLIDAPKRKIKKTFPRQGARPAEAQKVKIPNPLEEKAHNG